MNWFDQWLNDSLFQLRMLCEAPSPELRFQIVLMVCGGLAAITIWQHRRGLIPPSQRDKDNVEYDAISVGPANVRIDLLTRMRTMLGPVAGFILLLVLFAEIRSIDRWDIPELTRIRFPAGSDRKQFASENLLEEFFIRFRELTTVPLEILNLRILFMIVGGLWLLAAWQERRGLSPQSERPDPDDVDHELPVPQEL